MMRVVSACLLVAVTACGLFSEMPAEPTCDLSDAEELCDPAAVRVVGEVDGRTVDVSAPGDWGMYSPPSWTLGLFGEDVYFALWTGFESDEARPASGVLTIDPAGPLYCATVDTCVSTAGGGARARLTSLTELGSCPGPIPLEGEVAGCYGSDPESGCTVTGGPLFSGEQGVFGQGGVGAGGGETSVQVTLEDGTMVDADSVRGGGTLVYEGKVFCIGEIDFDAADPERITFAFRDLTAFPPCADAPAVSGSLLVCVPET